MATYWLVFCDITRQVFLSLFPEYVEMVLSYSISDPIKSHVYCSGFFAVTLMMLFAAVFYVVTGVRGCGWNISDRAVLVDVAF